MTFVIESKKSLKSYIKEFKDEAEAKEWVVNHLDLSLEWIIRLKGKRK
jgi:hypothetical protein